MVARHERDMCLTETKAIGQFADEAYVIRRKYLM